MATTNKPDDGRRPARVAARIREELASALSRDLSDPRLANVAIAAVRVSEDLQTAQVSIVVLGDDATGTRAEAARKVLTALEGGLRKRMAPRLAMRRLPTLKFDADRGREEVGRLEELLHEVGQELKKKPTE